MINKEEKVKIQFLRGEDEKDKPEIRLYRDKDGKRGRVTYTFASPSSITLKNFQSIKNMYLIDEEGEISTRKIDLNISGNFIKEIKSTYCWNSSSEFKRFIRFAQRHAKSFQQNK